MELLDKLLKKSVVDRLRSNGAHVGENVTIYANTGTVIDYGHAFLISIGDSVTMSNVTLLAHDASTKRLFGYSKVGKIIIGNNVFIGMKSIVLPNVRIGSNVIIGAGTLVCKDVPDNSVAVGNPVRVIGKYDDFVKKHEKWINEKPCYDTYYTKKSVEEKKQMVADIIDWGYDI